MERDARSKSERERNPDEAKPRPGRDRGPTRRLWSPFEAVEAFMYLLWGLGKLFFRGGIDV